MWWTSDTTGPDGTYDIDGLVSGNYRVCYSYATSQYVDECYANASTIDNAIDIAVRAGTVIANIDANLDNGTSDSQLVNISSRAEVLTGASKLIGGFVISGDEPKTVVVKGLGPTLSDRGVSGTLSDPTLTIYSGTSPIASNDNWPSDPRASEIPQSLQPGHSVEPALVITLDPGPYTAIVEGFNGETGIGRVAIDDIDEENSKLINISSRAFVDTGSKALIGGFVIRGSEPKTVLVKGLGPTLADRGVSGTLTNPTLTLYSGTQAIATNDDWETDENANLIPQALRPSHASDPAILITLPPGAYTGVVQGGDGETGIGTVAIDAID